jgi:hypothetical protein
MHDFEHVFNDCIFHLLKSVTRTARPLTEHIGVALRHFLASPMCVLWGNPPRHGSRVELRATSSLQQIEAEHVWNDISTRVQGATSPEAMYWANHGILCIPHAGHAEVMNVIWMVFTDLARLRSESCHRAEWLAFNATAQKNLFAVLDALQALSNRSTIAQVRIALEQLQQKVDEPLGMRLRSALALFTRWHEEVWSWQLGYEQEPLTIASALSLQMLHDVSTAPIHTVPVASLVRLTAQMREAANKSPLRVAHGQRLQRIADVLDALRPIGDDDAIEPVVRAWLDETPQSPAADDTGEPPPGELGLSLMLWARRAQSMARALATRTPARADAGKYRALWSELIETQLRPYLDAFLIRHAPDARASMDTAVLRYWLHLWFCERMLPSAREPDPMEDTLLAEELWQTRRAACHLLGEAVRAICFGNDPGYHFRPAMYAAGLRTLVIAHAHAMMRVPRAYGLGALLRDIGEPRSAAEYHSSTGHLQHVLDIYVAGHFILAIKEQSFAGAPVRALGEHLAARRGVRPQHADIRRLERAFSIATLFHDAGTLFGAQTYTPPRFDFGRDDRLMHEILSARQAQLVDANAPLVDHCWNALRRAGFIEDNELTAFDAWMTEQRAIGTSDHALTGAWYLHRIGGRVPNVDADVQRAAVRAVLLHGARTLPVYVGRDPVAALLVFCDELFEWETMLRRGPSANAVGRSLQAMAVSMRPHESRVDRITLPGLRITRGESGSGIDIWYEAPARTAAAPGLIVAELALRAPEQLYAQAYDLWLSMAQNLGRVHMGMPGEGVSDWYPMVVVTSREPWPIAMGSLLYQLAATSFLPPAPAITRWLLTQSDLRPDTGTPDTTGERREIIRISEHHALEYDQDIRRYVDDFDDHAERLARDAELRRRYANAAIRHTRHDMADGGSE